MPYLIISNLIEVTFNKMSANNKNEKNEENQENDINFIFIELLLIFLLSKCFTEDYYKHQNVSIILEIIIGIIKTIFFTIKDKTYQIPNFAIILVLNIIRSY